MKGAAATIVAAVLMLPAACGGAPPVGGHPTPSPSAPADPLTAAWHKCGATQVPPKEVRDAQLPGTTQVLWTQDISTNDAQRVLKAYGRTSAIVHWAIDKNELSFLQGTCIAAPLSRTEEGDINLTRAAMTAGGHAVFDPEPTPVKIGIRPVPKNVADAVQSRISSRPTVAVILIVSGATVWIDDSEGRHIRKYGESDRNALYESVTVGSVIADGIGIRFWQQWEYSCTDPEVSGQCDGI